ncbi:MAG: signal peptide peptidase SppA [Flavobacteriales bacterium]|nr:signal peptide peptidase SppA [Flavobacteriales bacterium]
MKQFFKFMFASMLGFVLSGLVLLFLAIGIVAAVVSGEKDEKNLVVKDNSVLYISFPNGVVDQGSDNPFESFDFNTFQSKKSTNLKDVLDNLDKAAKDDKIKGIYLELAGAGMELANLDEVRNGLLKFKESGKFIISYNEMYGQGGYYLSSVADKVYLYPEGDLDFKGLMTELAFFKGTLEKLDVEMQIIRGRNNKFKSAVEPFMYDKMSDANRKQVTSFLNSIWGEWLTNISASRNIDIARLNQIADSMETVMPKDALNAGLLDGLLYSDQVMDTLRGRLGIDAKDEIEFVSLSKYDRAPEKFDSDKPKPWEMKDKIAVIYAAGEIRSGKSDGETMGSETIAKAIKDARKDSTIKAIVLRVNSPGGSALASDVMWRETQLAKEAKPLVVSMGGLAASGGYYIACGADRIFAGPNTITGSIGVFGMMPYMGEFFKNKFGVTFDGVGTNANSNAGVFSRKLTDYQYTKIQMSVEKIYDSFTMKVANGRGLTQAEVDSIGQGRVWTGKEALEIGLVDELGGLEDAIAYAASKAGIANYRLKTFPEKQDPMEALIKGLSGESTELFVKWKFGEDYQYYKSFKTLTENSGILARMPFDLKVR